MKKSDVKLEKSLERAKENVLEAQIELERQTRIYKREFNRQLKEEVDSTERDIIANYEMGMIEIEEMVNQRIQNLVYFQQELYPYEEISMTEEEYPTTKK